MPICMDCVKTHLFVTLNLCPLTLSFAPPLLPKDEQTGKTAEMRASGRCLGPAPGRFPLPVTLPPDCHMIDSLPLRFCSDVTSKWPSVTILLEVIPPSALPCPTHRHSSSSSLWSFLLSHQQPRLLDSRVFVSCSVCHQCLAFLRSPLRDRDGPVSPEGSPFLGPAKLVLAAQGPQGALLFIRPRRGERPCAPHPSPGGLPFLAPLRELSCQQVPKNRVCFSRKGRQPFTALGWCRLPAWHPTVTLSAVTMAPFSPLDEQGSCCLYKGKAGWGLSVLKNKQSASSAGSFILFLARAGELGLCVVRGSG